MTLRFLRTIQKMFPRYAMSSFILGIIILSISNLVFILAEEHEERINTNSLCLYLLVIAYGISRVWRFHPIFKKDYLIQLALSPWNSSKELPRGPVYLNWVDIVIVGFFVLLTYIFPVHHSPIIPFIFLMGYNIGLFTAFCFTGLNGFIGLYTLLTPLIVFPHLNPYLAIVVLVGLTVIGTYGLHRYFKEFPWNTPWWKFDQVEELKKKAVQKRVIQWPFLQLGTTKKFFISIGAISVLSALIFWWLYTTYWFTTTVFPLSEDDKKGIVLGPYFLFLILCPFSRTIAYVSGHHPPISFWGRFKTGKLIIPKYDKVFLAPIFVICIGITCLVILRRCGIAEHIAYFLCISIILFSTLSLPPSFEKWHYTGKHHIVKMPIKPARTVKAKKLL